MVARYNSDLANDLGNLASRVLSMIGRYLGGVVPPKPDDFEITDAERSLIAEYTKAFDGMKKGIDDLAPHEALKSCWGFVRKANSYVEEVTPWALAKDEQARRRLEIVLYELADSLRLLALMVGPIMPHTADDLWGRLGLEGSVQDRRFPEDGKWGLLPEGVTVTVGSPLFPRLDVDEGA